MPGYGGLGDMPHVEPVGGPERSHGGAVIGVPAGDDFVGVRLGAAVEVVLLGELEGRFDSFGAAADEHRLESFAGAS